MQVSGGLEPVSPGERDGLIGLLAEQSWPRHVVGDLSWRRARSPASAVARGPAASFPCG